MGGHSKYELLTPEQDKRIDKLLSETELSHTAISKRFDVSRFYIAKRARNLGLRTASYHSSTETAVRVKKTVSVQD